MKRRRLPLYLAGILVAALAIGFVWLLHHRRTRADAAERASRERDVGQGPHVMVVRVQNAPPSRTIVLPGDVRALRSATVYAKVSGYLADLRVDRGDRVVRGQILGAVTSPETEQQLRPLLANLATLKGIADRLRPLVPKGVVAQQDLDKAVADVQAAQSEVDRLRATMGETTIRAPFAGIITKRYVDLGALMPAPTGSTQTAQPLVDVADLSRVRVVVYLGQKDAIGVHVGDPLSIVCEIDPSRPREAKVTRVPNELDLRTRTMWVETEVDNKDGMLYPGLFVSVVVHVPAPPGVVIPADAIALTDGKPSVAVVRDGHAHFTAIEVADDDGKVARVVRGLVPGDQIAARLSDELTDGGPVRPIEPRPEAQARGRAP